VMTVTMSCGDRYRLKTGASKSPLPNPENARIVAAAAVASSITTNIDVLGKSALQYSGMDVGVRASVND